MNPKFNIHVSVFQNRKCQESRKPVFCRSVYLEDSRLFPYRVVLDALRTLFCDDCIVVFEDSVVI